MNNKLLTYQEASSIVENSEHFIKKSIEKDNYIIHIFNYLLSPPYEKFNKPLKDSDISAFELRGLTFVESKIDSTYKRFPALHKFFNINQVEKNQIDLIKNREIINIQNKLDGSMITFYQLGDNCYPKTKMSIDNEQVTLTNRFINSNKNYDEFIKYALMNNIMPVFELVSPLNRIVINYDETELILIQLRNMKTGEYYNLYDNSIPNIKKLMVSLKIKYVKQEPILSLENYLDFSKSLKDTEGWVITYKDDMVKIKTEWYLTKHYILTDNVFKENKIIQYVLNEDIDDLKSEFKKDDSVRIKIESIEKDITLYFNHTVQEIIKILENKPKSKKEMFMMIKDNSYQKIIMSQYNKTEIDSDAIKNMLKKEILKDTYRLKEARNFLSKIKP